MTTNIDIIKKACKDSAYWRVETIPNLTKMLDEARADTIKTITAHMRVARSRMCLKDREILLRELNRLEGIYGIKNNYK